MSERLHFDYTTVGHVTIDVLPDGSRRPGGTALYSALQASRLGLRALVLTRGVPREIESLLAPYRDEIELQIEPAPETTSLATRGMGPARSQRMLAWAGPIERRPPPDSSILHLAPVARELSHDPPAHEGFLGLTPQGLLRTWPGADREVLNAEPSPSALRIAERCAAIVISEQERKSCSALVSAASHAGSLVAITAGTDPTSLLLPGGGTLEVSVDTVEEPADDLGAGDVYASALFIALTEGMTPQVAGTFAGAAAAERMRGVGPGAIAGREAIESRLGRLEERR